MIIRCVFQTSCKLHSKEKEVDKLKAELEVLNGPPLEEVITKTINKQLL